MQPEPLYSQMGPCVTLRARDKDRMERQWRWSRRSIQVRSKGFHNQAEDDRCQKGRRSFVGSKSRVSGRVQGQRRRGSRSNTCTGMNNPNPNYCCSSFHLIYIILSPLLISSYFIIFCLFLSHFSLSYLFSSLPYLIWPHFTSPLRISSQFFVSSHLEFD